MAQGQTLNIPAARFPWFKEQLDRLGAKAKKLNGERMFCTVIGFHNETDTRSRWHGERIMEVFVACPEPKLEGWEFVARIDHAHEVGNIVRTTGIRDLPEEYRNRGPVCDHCGHKRMRRDTFVVFKQEEGFKQVGSSCLKDFLGHGDASRIAKLAELLASLHGFVRASYEHEDAHMLNDLRWINAHHFAVHAAEHILTHGFVSKKQEFETGKVSTAERSLNSYKSMKDVSQAARDLAKDAIAWAQDLDESGEPLNDYLHNVWVIANTMFIEPRSTGIAASIVGVYYRSQQRTDVVSQHVGQVGEKLEIEVEVTDTRQLDSGSTLVSMRDTQGNVLKWFASGKSPSRGEKARIKGTVKAHNVFRDKKETILTRCRKA